MIYLDETLPHHPKIVQAGQLIGGKDGRLVALGLYVEAITYARHQVTDGVVPAPVIDEYPRRAGGRYTPATALVKVGLFDHASGGRYVIHDYHHWNPSAVEVKEQKRLAREKKARWRAGQRNGVHADVPRSSSVDKAGTGGGQVGTPDSDDPPSTIHHPCTEEKRKQPAAETAATPLPTLPENHILDSPVFDRRAVRERLAKASNGNNYPVLAKIAREAITDGTTYGELPREVEDRALEHRVSFTHETVVAACESEWFKHEHPDLVKQ
jgi:hypothetical protein